MCVACCQARDCIPNYPWQINHDEPIPQIIGVNMSVIVQIHACLVSNLFYRLTILKENLWAGPKDLSVLHTYATQLLSNNKKKVIKKKKKAKKKHNLEL